MIDSEPFHLKAFNSVLNQYGKTLTEKDNQQYIGLSDADAAADMVKKFKLPVTAADLALQKAKSYQKILTGNVKAQGGLKELLKKLKSDNYKLAVASSSRKEEIQTVLKKLDIEKFFKVVVSGDEVALGKPHPEIYLTTAQKLSVSPEECLVLEDAPNGVKSAKAAGMVCFAVPSRETKGQNFSNADRIFGSLKEIPTV